ncbi:TniB family NTP-binding protein [Acetobacter sicerae]|uniref:TniB family NTP-binding protein n=1 Tax=Acetobacter sicerae TaxID=85325 RepID=UPI00156B118A|nr:TniB family NTP-binding protein [Acetobacter sicerae]NHN93610.1 AAA family ATPase [Acetobacter sicerae]
MTQTYLHLHPDARKWASEDGDSRIARIRNSAVWIANSYSEQAIDVFQDIMQQPPGRRMLNVLLTAESGMGKTAILDHFARKHAHPFDQQSGVRRQPVVVALMPPNPCEYEFLDQVMIAAGAPLSPHRTSRATTLREMAMRVLETIGTRVLIVDEINSVLGGTARQQRLFLQLLRFLSNSLRIGFICAGTPEARQALMSDPQLRSRFLEVDLPVWSPNSELQQFLNRLVQTLPLREPSPIDSPALRRFIIERSGGVTEHMCRAFRRAAVRAIQSGHECIDLETLMTPDVWRGSGRPAAPVLLRRSPLRTVDTPSVQ